MDTIQETNVWPVNENGEILLQLGTGSSSKVGYIDSKKIPTDTNTSKVVVKLPQETALLSSAATNNSVVIKSSTGEAIVSSNYGDIRTVQDLGVARYHKLTGTMTSLLPTETGKFGFGVIKGNGTLFAPSGIAQGGSSYLAGGLDVEYANGITGLFERVDDSAFIGGTGEQAPAGQQYAWQLSCLTTHKCIGGGARTELTGYQLDFYKRYIFDFSFRLDNSGGAGFDFDQSDAQGMNIFQIHQESGYTGHNQAGTTPNVALYLTGSKLYFITRVVDSEMGYNNGTYLEWGAGDNQILNHGYVVCAGTTYNDIVIDMFLDDRMTHQGGRGYVKGTINGKPLIDYVGPTAWPLSATGTQVKPAPSFGIYMAGLSGSVTDDVTTTAQHGMLNSRKILFRKIKILDIEV